MVSTAIGGIIIGMILTGTNAAKSKAREVQCMNNMRTWGQLMSSFAGDNRQQLWVSDTHTATDASGNLLNMQPWNSGAESPYGIYLNATSTVTTIAKLRMCPGAVNLGYAVTAYSPIRPLDMRDRYWVQLLNVARPSQYFILCDTTSSGRGLSDFGGFSQYVKPVCAKPTTDVIRHGGRFNVLFADFHVASYSWSEVEKNRSATIDVWTKAAGQ